MNSFEKFSFIKFFMRSFSISNLTSKVLLTALIFTFNIISVGFVQAQTFDFYRSLKVGDEGQDVLILQKILNQDPDTRIAQSGIGSLGNETIYFGNLTKNAVIKFQNKYRNEVLVPAGLYVGTGYFGPSTIGFIEGSFNTGTISVDNQNTQPTQSSKSFEELLVEIIAIRDFAEQLNQQKKTEQSAQIESSKNIKPKPLKDSNMTVDQSKLIRSDSIELYFVSQTVFEPGVELTVVGGGINKDSEIYFFNFENDKVVSSVKIESNFIFFEAPNLSEGEYEIYIKNGNFISKPLVVEIVGDYNPPKISSVSPSSISYGDTVTIKGSNFESQNIIITPLGTYQSSSNGSEIKFVVDRFSNLPTNGEVVSPVEQKIEGIIQVQNSNGSSDAKFVDFIYN